jgi:UDP-N-acetyl-D-glucosamine dehydrogenase
MGVAYKRDINDVRESPALDVIHLLLRRGARVTFSDPFVSQLVIEGREDLYSQPPLQGCSDADCVVIVTDHSSFDYAAIVENSSLIVDTRNALRQFSSNKIVRL